MKTKTQDAKHTKGPLGNGIENETPSEQLVRFALKFARTHDGGGDRQAVKETESELPTHADLRYIVYYAPEAWKAKAWERLIADSPTHADLRYIVYCAPEAYAKKARKLLEVA